ncbi:MAG: hypothetical protein AAFO84_13320 [Cyanobacteria bacterium J06598_1]
MFLRKAIYRLAAIGFTSTVLLSLSSVAAQAASFNLSYSFRNGTSLSALFNGELEENGNMVALDSLESASLTDVTGNLLDFDPNGLNFASPRLTLDGGFAKLSAGSPMLTEPDAVGFKLFNNAKVGGRDFSFATVVYQNSQGNNVRLAEAFSYGAYSFDAVDIPESSSVSVLLTALAGMGLATAKKHGAQKEA